MKNISFLLLLLLSCINIIKAGNTDKGKLLFDLEKYKEAMSEFAQYSSDNDEAVYWYYKSAVANNSSEKGDSVLQKTQEKFPSSAWIQITYAFKYLLKGNTTETTKSFNTALGLTNNNNKNSIKLEIGYICGHVPLKYALCDFGILQLKEVIKAEPKNGKSHIYLGDCYRKKLDGGAALTAYADAMQADTSLKALANYKIGLIYVTQQNCTQIIRYLEESVKINPMFMPAWRELYIVSTDQLYSCQNTAKGKIYFDTYLKLANPGAEAPLEKARFLYHTGDYSEAATLIKNNFYYFGPNGQTTATLLGANCYYKLGSYKEFVEWMNNYFNREKNPENILPFHYKMLGKAHESLLNYTASIESYQKAADMAPDTLQKIQNLSSALTVSESQKLYGYSVLLAQKIVDLKVHPISYDLYRLGYAQYNNEAYNDCIKTFTQYQNQYPTDWRAPLFIARSHAQLQSDSISTEAVNYYKKAAELLASEKKQISNTVECYLYLFAYEINVAKNKEAGLQYLDKVLLIDPANITAKKYKDQFTK